MGIGRTNEIDQVAGDWLVRRDSENWSAADQERLEGWLSASTLNRVAFLRLELAWEDAARLKALGAGIQSDQPPPPGHWNLTPFFDPRSASPSASEAGAQGIELSPLPAGEKQTQQLAEEGEQRTATFRATVRRGRVVAAAAILLITAGVTGYVQQALHRNSYVTPVGGFASVPMSDGSKVTLNTDSQIRIALTETERRVELNHGEAFFEVSKDPKRPFVVRAGSQRVIAVGTKFSVRSEGGELEVVVTEGKVRIENNALEPGSPAARSADVFLIPGSIARIDEAGVLVQRRTLPEAEDKLSWRTGVLMFRDQSLQEAAAEFNRYNVRKIVLKDPAIASLKIEGNFRATNVEAFVRLLESGFPVHAESSSDQILLTAKQ
jgi:transmembrane sensor